MKDELAKVRKAVNDLPDGAVKAALLEVLARFGDGGVTTQDSGGGTGGNPPTPPIPPK